MCVLVGVEEKEQKYNDETTKKPEIRFNDEALIRNGVPTMQGGNNLKRYDNLLTVIGFI